jgi:uncharacterized protein YuzE
MTIHPKPAWLVEKEITLDNGSTVLWSYDSEGDFLEIFFQESPATATVELAEGIFLRLNLEQGKALSLGFVSAMPLLQPGEFGPYLLRLNGLDELSPDLRQTVLAIITSPPVSYVLKVFSYLPSPDAEVPVPIAGLDQLAT